jgi:hypothetical protein
MCVVRETAPPFHPFGCEPQTSGGAAREEALETYEELGDVFQECGDFVVLAAFTTDRRR